MSKNIKIAALGIAALATAAAPMMAMAADADGTKSVTDKITVTIDSACSLTQETGTYTGAGAAAFNEYSATLALGNSVEFSSSASGKKGLIIKCNDAGDWSLQAQGVKGVDSTEASNQLIGTTATNFITSSATWNGSDWGFYLVGANVKSAYGVATGEGTYAAVPTTATVVAEGQSTASNPIEVHYKVAASTTQAADTYTGYVKYTLVHPKVTQ